MFPACRGKRDSAVGNKSGRESHSKVRKDRNMSTNPQGFRSASAKYGWPRIKPDEVPVGVVGLGLMGTSIITCLLAAGHPVVGVDSDELKRRSARRRVLAHLKGMKSARLLRANPREVVKRLNVSGDYSVLDESEVVIEAIFENIASKRKVIRAIERIISSSAIIGSNTSAIPVSLLQRGAQHPERILGIHWSEPAYTTPFMEIICGNRTDPNCAERVSVLASFWGKAPSILRRDIRGFITNRCLYALLREVFYLVESGYATIEDVDRSLRNDLGYWITFAGPFRFMDITGIPAYRAVMRDLYPKLCCTKKVPALMDRVVNSGARGISNSKGFYRYAPQEAKRWEKRFLKFSYEIRALAQKYPEDAGRTGGHGAGESSGRANLAAYPLG